MTDISIEDVSNDTIYMLNTEFIEHPDQHRRDKLRRERQLWRQIDEMNQVEAQRRLIPELLIRGRMFRYSAQEPTTSREERVNFLRGVLVCRDA
jgi:hypothetical protein